MQNRVIDFLYQLLAAAILAGAPVFFFYPLWSQRAYMVEYSIVMITGIAAYVFVALSETGPFNPKLIPVVALLWLYAVGQAVRIQTIAQLPCTAWEKTTCTACLDEEITQSGPHCVASEDYECDACIERTWRASEWK